jgi:hypothetical protein
MVMPPGTLINPHCGRVRGEQSSGLLWAQIENGDLIVTHLRMYPQMRDDNVPYIRGGHGRYMDLSNYQLIDGCYVHPFRADTARNSIEASSKGSKEQ